VSEEGLRAGGAKMREAGLAEEAVAYFRHYYEQLVAGDEGVVWESEIEPVEELPTIGDLEVDVAAGRDALGRLSWERAARGTRAVLAEAAS